MAKYAQWRSSMANCESPCIQGWTERAENLLRKCLPKLRPRQSICILVPTLFDAAGILTAKLFINDAQNFLTVFTLGKIACHFPQVIFAEGLKLHVDQI